jgi:tetratricopeptide (TPR) repeat protein
MRIAILCPALVFTLASAMARADGADPVAAEALFREGRSAADAGNYAVACPKFEESYRLDPAPGTLLNLGDCEEHRGQLALALQHYRQLHAELPETDDRRPIAAARARALELRASKVHSVPAAEPVADTKTVPDTNTVPARPEATRPTPRDGSVQRTTAFVVGGAGFAFLATGSIFGVVALSNLASANSRCTGNACSSQDAVNQFNRAQSFAIAADVAIGVGVALIGTAIVLALTAPHKQPPVWIGGRF